MGTNPIFESDFDCLTEIMSKKDEGENNSGLVVGGLLGLVALPLALPAMGFTAAGVAAGSLAAGIQSAVYGGATAGVFSAAQSAAVVGTGMATKAAAVAVGASAGAAYDGY